MAYQCCKESGCLLSIEVLTYSDVFYDYQPWQNSRGIHWEARRRPPTHARFQGEARPGQPKAENKSNILHQASSVFCTASCLVLDGVTLCISKQRCLYRSKTINSRWLSNSGPIVDVGRMDNLLSCTNGAPWTSKRLISKRPPCPSLLKTWCSRKHGDPFSLTPSALASNFRPKLILNHSHSVSMRFFQNVPPASPKKWI